MSFCASCANAARLGRDEGLNGCWRGVVMEDPADEIKNLKACINDLISVLALPAIWTGGEPSQIITTLLDVLLGMLRLSFAYARISTSIGAVPIATVRLSHAANLTVQPEAIDELLRRCLSGEPARSPQKLRSPVDGGEISVALLPLGLAQQVGVLVAASERVDFPTPSEKLLLQVAANQAAIGLEESRLMTEQRRVAEELDRRVAERTRELTALNQELSKENTERRRAQQALRESEQRWRAVFDNSAAGITLTDSAGRFLAANSAYQKMVGYSEEELRHLSFLDITHDDYRHANSQLTTELLEGKREYFKMEKRYRCKDGSLIWVRIHVSLVATTQSTPRLLLAIEEDITERKLAEETLRQTQAELAHVNRVTTLGEMTALIAHEINQPLAAITNNASASLRWLAANNLEEARKSAELVRTDGHRAGQIIQRIRSFAKKAPPQKDWINTNQTIDDVIALARSEMERNGIALEMQLSDAVQPLVFADRVQLQQVILNLAMNAAEAMSEQGEDPRQLVIRTDTDTSGAIVVSLRDSGPGLSPENLDRLFRPFYTTKPQGMGMGLAICRSIIEAHGGRLWATPNEERGATFQFTLPAVGAVAS
jgi:PAS domain S-box-containing protein